MIKQLLKKAAVYFDADTCKKIAEKWESIKNTSAAEMFISKLEKKIKASEDEKLPTATAKKQQVSNPSSTGNYTPVAQVVNIRTYDRNYNDISKYACEDLHKCPLCGSTAKYKVCPEHWFEWGRFVPAVGIEVQQ